MIVQPYIFVTSVIAAALAAKRAKDPKSAAKAAAGNVLAAVTDPDYLVDYGPDYLDYVTTLIGVAIEQANPVSLATLASMADRATTVCWGEEDSYRIAEVLGESSTRNLILASSLLMERSVSDRAEYETAIEALCARKHALLEDLVCL